MTATEHPTLHKHWFVNETKTIQQTTTDEEGNEVTQDVEVFVAQHLVACASAERAIEIMSTEPTGDLE